MSAVQVVEGDVGDVKDMVRITCASGHPHASRTFRFFLAIDPKADDTKEAVMGCAVFYPIFGLERGVELYLDNIVVRKKYQRRGVARALMQALRDQCLKEGISRVTWEVMSDNDGAIALYEGLQPPCVFKEKRLHWELKVCHHLYLCTHFPLILSSRRSR